MKKDIDKRNDTLKHHDAKTFWEYVDWKGNYKCKKLINSPTIKQFECFFEELYDNNNPKEINEIMALESDTYIPVLDNPISGDEMNSAWK